MSSETQNSLLVCECCADGECLDPTVELRKCGCVLCDACLEGAEMEDEPCHHGPTCTLATEEADRADSND